MSKKAARILSLVAFVALFVPCGNFLSCLDFGCGAATGWRFMPLRALGVFLLDRGFVFLAGWVGRVLCALLDLLLVRVLFRYLDGRDFPRICADCAAHPGRAWTFFALYAFFTFVVVSVSMPRLSASSWEGNGIDGCVLDGENVRHLCGTTWEGRGGMFFEPGEGWNIDELELEDVAGANPGGTDECQFSIPEVLAGPEGEVAGP